MRGVLPQGTRSCWLLERTPMGGLSIWMACGCISPPSLVECVAQMCANEAEDRLTAVDVGLAANLRSFRMMPPARS